MFWINIGKNFSRFADAALRVPEIPLAQALSERTFSQITSAQKQQQSCQSSQSLKVRLCVKNKVKDGSLQTFSLGDDSRA